MKLFAGAVLLAVASLAQPSFAQGPITGTWTGTSTAHHKEVPVTLAITGSAPNFKAALINGPESSPASNVALTGNHLVISFNYYARTLDATLDDGKLTGSFGTASVRYPITLQQQTPPTAPPAPPAEAKAALGDWEVQVKSAKGEAAWQLHVEPLANSSSVRAVIQRIDGDTGSLFGHWVNEPSGGYYLVSHYTAAGPALYSFAPQPDGTLHVTNLLHADLNPPDQQNLTARRPAEARKENLAPPQDPTQQTTVKDPSIPFAFSAPDLSGKLVANTDPQFDGKVVIVAIGGSWCPNCHDEAPMLVSLYKQFHDRGLEIVNLSFEDTDQIKNPTGLRAFIARYNIPYTVLLAGDTDQLNEKVPQAVNLNCWPTSFFLGRDGRVREVHAGFAGPANPPAHAALVHETTELVEKLLDEPVPTHSASR
jgi:thiol-disulfide isomerase/thioredoxin